MEVPCTPLFDKEEKEFLGIVLQEAKKVAKVTKLDFLLMKLRTALDRGWLQSLPTLHKVVYFVCF